MDWRDEYDSAIAERNRLIMALTAAEKRAEAAERRVAKLEARLADQEWRPVTGDMAAGHYLVFNENEPQLSEVMELVYNDILRQWYIPNGYDDIMPAPTHWRPLPPPPQGENIDDL